MSLLMAVKLKVLIIDHMGILRLSRKKCVELSKYKDIELVLLTPRYWILNYRNICLEQKQADEKYRIVTGKTVFPGNGWRGFYYTGLLGTLYEFKPDIIHILQEPWSFFTFQTIFFARILCSRSKIVFLTWENIYRDFTYDCPLTGLYALIDRYTYRNSDCATPITREAAQVLQRKGFSKRIKVIPWGTDPQLFKKTEVDELRGKLGLTDSLVIGYVGRLVQEKGILTLIEAASKLHGNYKILLVGSGPLKEIIIARAKSLEIDDCLVFVETVSQRQLPQYYNCMDILVLPSCTTAPWKEQLGRVLIEAMACEIPVVGSDSGEIPQVIGKAGLIFPEGQSEELRKRLVSLIEKPGLRKDLGRRGRQRVLSKYTWQKYARETHSLYQELIETAW